MKFFNLIHQTKAPQNALIPVCFIISADKNPSRTMKNFFKGKTYNINIISRSPGKKHDRTNQRTNRKSVELVLNSLSQVKNAPDLKDQEHFLY